MVALPLPLIPAPNSTRYPHCPHQARAHGAWNWLAAVCFFTLKERHQDDEHARSKPDSTAAAASRAGGTLECRETLEAGAAGMARAHLAVMLARPLLEGAALYPAAMAHLHVATRARPPRAGLPEQALPIARGRPWLEAGSGPRRPCCHIWLNVVWTGGATGATRGRPTGGQIESREIGRRKCAGFPQLGQG